jgi:hypothetical protein
MSVDGNHIFGPGADGFTALISRLEIELSSNRPKYVFCPPDQFEFLLINETGRAQRIYWTELIGRAHLASVGSMLRSVQWLKGALGAYEQDLYLPFCANLRSLIESAADSLTGLSGVAQAIAENKVAVNEALNMKSDKIVISGELENQLIHFSHARKLAKGEVAPSSHAASSAKSYVEKLEKLGLSDAYSIYSKLCQVTHPAAESVSHFMSQTGSNEFMLAPHNDRVAMETLIKNHTQFFHAILRYAFNQPIILLRVLLHIDLREYHSAEISQLNLADMPGWQKCAGLMGVSP